MSETISPPAAEDHGPAESPDSPVFSTVTTEEVVIAEQEILPEDALSHMGDDGLLLEKRPEVAPDDTLTATSRTPVDKKQRVALDEQIEALYRRVTVELSDNPADVSYALDKLRQAQDIVLGDVQRSDEALYWIFVVNQMLVRRQNLRRWSYTWGMFLFFYAIVWLVVLLAGFFVQFQNLATGSSTIWFAALAGGIGGVVTILYDLSWHVSIRNDFDRQYVMKYLVYPIMGFVLGAVVYLITGAGFIAINTFAGSPANTLSAGVLSVQVVLGFVAGFQQQIVYDMADLIMRRFSSGGGSNNASQINAE
ncbi:MAG: hypothetical protein Kow0031_03660 [Anaerolineae bacterium]